MIGKQWESASSLRRPRIAAAALCALSVAALLGFDAAPALAGGGAWKVLGVTAPTNLPPTTAEVQSVAVDAGSGTFTLTLDSETTAPLPFDASADQLRAALEGLSALSGPGAVAVTGGPGDPGAELPYFVSFRGPLAGVDVSQMTGAASAGTVVVATETEGAPVGSGELVAFATNVAASPAPLPVRMTIGPLPAGIETAAAASGNGWTCPGGAHETVVTCERTAPVEGGETAERIRVPLSISGAAEHSTVAIAVEGGGELQAGLYQEPVTVSSAPAPPGVAGFWAGAFNSDGEAETQAGAHPFLAMTFLLRNTVLAADGRVIPAGDLRTALVDLPAGFLGDPLVTERCPQGVLGAEPDGSCGALADADEAAIGHIAPFIGTFPPVSGEGPPIYNDVPPQGFAAEFSGKIGIPYQSFLGSVRSDEDFGVTITAPNVPNFSKVYGAIVSLDGVPAAAGGRAFLSASTDCGQQAASQPQVSIATDTWQSPELAGAASPQPPVTGCDRLQFEPSFSFQPASTEAATGTAATASLHVPQDGLTDPNKLATPHLRKTVVALPAGLSLNPAAANGLQACSEGQIGFQGGGYPLPSPLRFDESTPACPDASKLGTVRVKTPLLEEELNGTIYLAAQGKNPFGSLIALYLVVDDRRSGVVLKLAGEVEPDPGSGQLTASFDDNPQLPFEDLELHFRGGGPRSQLATPDVCGAYRSTGELTPWSAPESGPPAPIEEAGFRISSGPGGGACADSAAARPFAPSFVAGSRSTRAGAFAPLAIRVARKDGEQELTRLRFTLPPGVTAKLAGIPYCPDAAIAAARARSGEAEQANPSCPAASELGTVDSTAGVGSEPIHVPGRVYLAGPYEGAPLSSVVVTPAVAGPFDLGDVVVRAPLYVDPETAQITAKSDPIPTILDGIPLQLRSVEIVVDRHEFALNPTSCEAMAVSASLSGGSGAVATPSNRFLVNGCAGLPFRPKLSLRVFGKTNRNAKPRLRAVLTARPGEANIARAQVNLPHSEFLEQSHIRTVCTRAQFAAGDGNGSACPAGSIYGRARAWTPLLARPLEGPVYLRSSSHELPDLVAALNGQIDVALAGRVDSGANEGIRNTFEVVPDAPVSRFVLEMRGGRKGLLVNSENLCSPRAKRQAIVRLVGQNGKVRRLKPKVGNQCGRKGKRPQRQQRRQRDGGALLSWAW